MILMNDFRAEPTELIQQEIAAVEKVIKSGWYILGSCRFLCLGIRYHQTSTCSNLGTKNCNY